jgi:hypothetical protein
MDAVLGSVADIKQLPDKELRAEARSQAGGGRLAAAEHFAPILPIDPQNRPD